MASPRDQRSLRRQIQEDDDDAIEIIASESETDTGGGITKFLKPTTRDPGFSKKRIPVAQPKIEENNPRGVEYEDCSEDPSDSEQDAATSARAEAVGTRESDGAGDPAVPSARADTVDGLGAPTNRNLVVPSARADTADGTVTPTKVVRYELLVGTTPSTPEEERQFDDDSCPATRAEFRTMRKQLKETRAAVNELIRRRHEDDEFIDMKTLLRVAQRSNQTTRDQLEKKK